MLNILRKIFIKNYQDISNPKVRQAHGEMATIVGIFTNILLFIAKIIIGVLTLTFSIITDAINNLSDSINCITTLIGFKLANKPADKKHPFGHQRIEYLAALVVAFIIIVLAVVMGYTSIMKIINKSPTNIDSYAVFIVLGLSILIKLWQSLFYKRMSKLINSLTLKANSLDSLNDSISTTLILIVTIIIYVWGDKIPNSYLIDPIVGIILSLFIIYTGIKLVYETADVLIGKTPDKEFVDNIIKDVLSFEGVYGVHDVIVHNYGPTTVFMSLHVEVDSSQDVLLSHDLIDVIEYTISNKYNIQLTIHMDPIVLSSPLINKIKEYLNKIIKEYTNENIRFHDLRVVEGNSHTNVIFDIELPFDSKIKEEEIISYLYNNIKKLDNKYFAVIKVDRC